jgi:quinol monooxygenase YgiN
MLAITAIIHIRKGSDALMRQALLDVASNAHANEPGTVGYHISQDSSDPCVFTTYERYADQRRWIGTTIPMLSPVSLLSPSRFSMAM